MSDAMKLAERILDSMREAHMNSISTDISRMLDLKICESPIEALLGAALVEYDRIVLGSCAMIGSSEEDIEFYGKDKRLLIHQRKFRKYRIDWALRDPPHEVFIECDGRDFHERTKKQAAHDREKDRIIQQAGFPILRFTGSEIFQDPIGCASQVVDFMNDLQTGRAAA